MNFAQRIRKVRQEKQMTQEQFGELADVIIRVLDYCGYAGIDIDAAISQKHEYNRTRPYRHGGKKC